jgi:hypothetical protein
MSNIAFNTGLKFNFENHPEESAEEILAKIDGEGPSVGLAIDTGWLGTPEPCLKKSKAQPPAQPSLHGWVAGDARAEGVPRAPSLSEIPNSGKIFWKARRAAVGTHSSAARFLTRPPAREPEPGSSCIFPLHFGWTMFRRCMRS